MRSEDLSLDGQLARHGAGLGQRRRIPDGRRERRDRKRPPRGRVHCDYIAT